MGVNAQEVAVRSRNLIKRMAFCALLVCAVPILSSWAKGGLIFNYAPVNVGSLTITGYEDTTLDTVAKFGAPTGGSSLAFPNYVLNSTSVNGVGAGAVTDTLELTMSSTTEYIKSVNFTEGGNYFLSGFSGPPAPAASASIASAAGPNGSKVVILALNGVDLAPGSEIDVFPISGDFSTNHSFTGVFTNSGDWTGTLGFDMSAYNATKVKLVLNNVVNTTSNGAVAFLGGAKAAVSMNIGVAPIPEPSTIALLCMGALALPFVRKRK
jgi:hypothetical protein